MKKYSFKYDYENVERNENQYDYDSLNNKAFVDAKYRKAINPCDRGNPFIEALPIARNFDQAIADYLVPLKDYDANMIKNFSKEEKMFNVNTLRNFRIPLPFVHDLETNFYNTLTQSYRTRYIINSENHDKKLIINNNEVITNSVTYADSDDAANSSFGLIGYAGCGKSSSLKILLENYPQVIIHHPSPGSTICQIVYLVVNCAPNSNFNALYTSIAQAIDKALGNIEPHYEKIFLKNMSLGAKTLKIRELIETFSIGIILLDEIQLIDFTSSKEASFESLMSLTNMTKIAFGVIGTEDALDKMFSKLRTARRVGKIINADDYISRKEYFSSIVSFLFRYQWFDNTIEPTKEIIDVLYEKSGGIIEHLIKIYIYTTIDSLKQKNCIVNADFFSKSVESNFPNLQKMIKDIKSPDNRKKTFKSFYEISNKVNNVVNLNEQNDIITNINSKRKEQIGKVLQVDNIIANIDATQFNCSNDMIRDVVKKVVFNTKYSNLSEEELSAIVTKALCKKCKIKL